MVAQTIRPAEWAIVSDASTDGTDKIVQRYARAHSWIRFIRRNERDRWNFASKVHCFNAGYEALTARGYGFIGNIDGDITLPPDHFEFLLGKFQQMPDLGVAGTMMVEKTFDVLRDSVFHEPDVFGACQFFRRECFEDIGGYQAVRGGGVDWLAVRMARMKGWKTRTFLDKTFYHHHPMGHGDKGVLFARYDYGRKDYLFGNHPLWEMLRIGFQMMHRPYVIGGILLGAGYFSSLLRRVSRPFPSAVIRFNRQEQMQRMLQALRMKLGLDRSRFREV